MDKKSKKVLDNVLKTIGLNAGQFENFQKEQGMSAREVRNFQRELGSALSKDFQEKLENAFENLDETNNPENDIKEAIRIIIQAITARIQQMRPKILDGLCVQFDENSEYPLPPEVFLLTGDEKIDIEFYELPRELEPEFDSVLADFNRSYKSNKEILRKMFTDLTERLRGYDWKHLETKRTLISSEFRIDIQSV